MVSDPRIAADDLLLRRVGDHARKIEQNAGGVRLLSENGGEERAVTAADVDRGLERLHAIAREHPRIGDGRQVGHGLAEQRLGFRVLGVILPDRHAVDALERGSVLIEAALDLAPRVVVVVAEFGFGNRPHAAGPARPERVRQRRLREHPFRLLMEIAVRRERPHETAQRPASRAGRFGDLRERCPFSYRVRELEPRGQVDRAREPVAGDEVKNGGLRRMLLLHGCLSVTRC